MKGQRLAALVILAAVTTFVYDNGPDPVSDGCVRIVDEKGLVGYAKPDGTVIIEPRFAFGFPFVDGIARVTQKGKRVEVPGSSGEYHRWESNEWFCIDKTGAALECPGRSK